ncbi:MAG TPA: S1 RNA-binding domain-containing protein [Polyangiaceae bacterium]|jgi:small subunit ribosomal protein S1|nr:S1 RNA-binding domain-containing protein [Polyangiaceae bacterium]
MSSDAPAGDSFAALFEQQSNGRPERRSRSFKVGDKLDVIVVQVGRDAVFVELDGKRQGFLEADELRDESGEITVKPGDRVTAHVLEANDQQGMFRLGKSFGKTHGVDGLERAKAAGVPVEGKVLSLNKGGAEVEVGGVRAFCPMGQLDSRFVQDASAFIGQSLSFLVSEVKDGGKSVVLSRRALLERDAHEAFAKTQQSLVPGATLTGTVTSIREFGAFVDLGGIEGLIPRSEIGHDRSVAVGDALRAGETVEVLVREVKEMPAPEGKGRRGPQLKITLSLKALMADPWQGLDLVEGKVLDGTVVRTQPFGAFVRIAPGVEGLLHVSEQPKGVELGDGTAVRVVVKKLDLLAKKIGLGVAPEGAEVGSVLEVPRAAVAVRVNAVVTGVVEKIETFGLFVQLDGVTGRGGRGLIPNAETGLPRGADLRKAFPEGTKVSAKVLETGEGKLRLSLRAAKDAEERAQFEQARSSMKAPASLGTFGDLLKKVDLNAKAGKGKKK